MVGWAIELSEFDIHFVPRGPLKAQAMADFVAELTSPEKQTKGEWTLYVDGSSNKRGSGAGIILQGPDGIQVEQSLRFNFKASNNQAEYEALIAGMSLAIEMDAIQFLIRSDSQLVVSQVQGEYQAKDEQLAKYLNKVGLLKEKFEEVKIEHVPREKNTRANILAKLASTKKPGNNQSVIQLTLQQPSVETIDIYCLQIEENWMTKVKNYLREGLLPEDEKEKQKTIKESSKYVLLTGILYIRGVRSEE